MDLKSQMSGITWRNSSTNLFQGRVNLLNKGQSFYKPFSDPKIVAPTHDEANIPIKNMKISDVTNPRPARRRSIQ